MRPRLVLADHRARRGMKEPVASAGVPVDCLTLEELESGRFRPVDVRAEGLGLIQFSSGTTGDPKPVALSHEAIVNQAVLLNRFWPDTGGARHSGVSWLPLYHDMGLIGCVMPALERPGTLTLIPPELFVARPAVWLRTISRYQASISVAPSFAYGHCADRIRDEEMEGVDLGCWRVALNGAETVASSVVRRFQERFGPFGFSPGAMTPVYGMSETALAVTFSPLHRAPQFGRFDRARLGDGSLVAERDDGVEIASVGSPLPGFEVRIVDSHRQPVPATTVGTVLVRGPSLMDGYFGQPERTAEVLRDGWLDTGDLGFLRDGELYLTGRTRDLLLLRGRNHSPDEVERAVSGVAGVRPGAVVAVSFLPDGGDGEELLLMIEARRGIRPEERESLARECARAVLSSTGLSTDRVVVLDPGRLPRTSSGKLRRGEALRRFRAGSFAELPGRCDFRVSSPPRCEPRIPGSPAARGRPPGGAAC